MESEYNEDSLLRQNTIHRYSLEFACQKANNSFHKIEIKFKNRDEFKTLRGDKEKKAYFL